MSFYRLLLRLLPRDRRQRHGDQMTVVFADLSAATRRKSGAVGVGRLWMREAVGMLRFSLREWSGRLRVWLNRVWPTGSKGPDQLRELLRDLRHAVRLLRRSPSFAVVAVTTMAIGIGGATAMFSVVNAVLLKPLPYVDPSKLVRIWSRDARGSQPGSDQSDSSPGDFLDWQARAHTLSGMSAFTMSSVALSGQGEPEQIAHAGVSPNFFDLLGARPARGRSFRLEDAVPERSVAVISDGLWKGRFSADPDVIGRAVSLDGQFMTVVGIMAPGFNYPIGAEVWTPLRLTSNRGGAFLQVVARIASGRTLSDVRTEMNTLAKTLEQQYPQSNTGMGANILPLREQEVGAERPVLLVLFAMVGVLLLIAGANLANLLSARASTRGREMALRAALGAGRAQLIRQLLTESVLLSVLGGAAGLIAAVVATPLLLAMSPEGLSRAAVTPDGSVLLFTATISVAAGLLFGLAPALQMRGGDLERPLREAGRSGTAAGIGGRTRRWLVVSEIALALVVLTSAGLMIKSVRRVLAVNAGFRPTNVLTLQMSLPSARYTVEQVKAFYPDLIARVERLPGVVSAATTFMLPLGGDNRVYGFRAESLPPGRYLANFRVVSPHYFRTMGMVVTRGREFTDHDTAEEPPYLIVNQQMANRYWPGSPGPLGQRVVVRGSLPAREIVGVINDVRHFGLESGAEPEMYVPHAQFAASDMTVVVRTTADPRALIPSIKAQVYGLDRDLPVSRIRTMDTIVAAATAPRRFAMLLVNVFAGLALLLAVVGVYGVTAHAVNQRTGEIGVRVALGATPMNILALIVGHHARLLLTGTAIGTVGTLAVGRIAGGLLFQVQPNDPIVLLTGALTLASAAFGATYVPARRALRIDPVVALRRE